MRKRTKFVLLRVSVLLAFAILAGRLWYVQVVMSSYYKAQGDTSKIRTISVQARRGIIYDDAGRQLVWNAPSWNIEIVPHGIPSAKSTQIYHLLSTTLGGKPSAAEIRNLVWQGRFRPYEPAIIKTDVTTQTAMIVIEYHNRLPGVRADPGAVRHYREDNGLFSLSHILGYAGLIDGPTYKLYRSTYPRAGVSLLDQTGKTGIEYQLDPYLHGVNGTQRVEVDAGERPVRVLHSDGGVPGDSVHLTLDWKLQQKVSRDLAAALAHVGLRRGVAILEDVQTGAVRAMVSLPSFNANDFSHRVSAKEFGALMNDPAHPLNDMATAGVFPPGSTYKIITAAAALQSHVIDGSTVVNDNGQIKIPCAFTTGTCQTYMGWFPPPGLGPMNIQSALAQSSDIFFWTVAGGNPNLGSRPYVGVDRLSRFAKLFGMGSPTGIDLPGEAAGLVPHRTSQWHIGDTYNMAIGQGDDLATPLQMVNITATIANGGTLYQPKIIGSLSGRVDPKRGILRKSRALQSFVPTVMRRNFIAPENIALIQSGLHASVQPFPKGTSYNVVDNRIDPAGKTGTAEDHPENQPNVAAADAWWVGYAPFSQPKVAVVVLVPNAGSEGAFTAAPIARKLLDDYFNLPPVKQNWLSDVTRSLASTGGH